MSDAPLVQGGSIETVELTRGAFRAQFVNLGAALRILEVPDRSGDAANVMLGFQDLEAYRGAPRFYGAVAGRYANRIGGARFTLDGTEYRLGANDGANSLHSGPLGFDQQFWSVEARDEHSVTYALESPDGFNGFPGTLRAQVRYTLEADGLSIELSATTDKPTVVNLTSHGYFNLAGEASGATILEHLLQIPAGRFTPADETQIPTGEMRAVEGTPFDFRTPRAIGRDIEAEDEQLRIGSGYDHNFVLDGTSGALRRIATLFDPASGRVMDVHSTEPGVQLYTGNFLAGGAPGNSGRVYAAHDGLCLEPQRFPDSPNQPEFPSARLDPGETCRHEIALRFRVAEDVAAAFGSV
ncbi:aldose epimerase family protein [Sphingomonas sp. S2-65]|uniref:aldose epimerase family protein n=1 Tax=Sphingomonas sp. S2-65 TaxID=2903960 RepID=UPI001F2BC261|nr:aldose epimerase family protein [Sphingomonas sp. S2-65]UYY57548.1 galactose mutarotase [Sphingomonas sp. S2-65]